MSDLQKIINRGDGREESFYHCLKDMIDAYAGQKMISKCEVGILPKTTEAGNPDFRIWDGKAHITGYIEAKKPEQYNLDPIAVSEQVADIPNVLSRFTNDMNDLLRSFIENSQNFHNIMTTSFTDYDRDLRSLFEGIQRGETKVDLYYYDPDTLRELKTLADRNQGLLRNLNDLVWKLTEISKKIEQNIKHRTVWEKITGKGK
ncbi:MAG: hypothetical protein Q8M98_08910 [Candidatus Cloacimonadaceae bacterium]|nr:hypothetical protein [Candidatus Cloacimonadaceae bacterium]